MKHAKNKLKNDRKPPAGRKSDLQTGIQPVGETLFGNMAKPSFWKGV